MRDAVDHAAIDRAVAMLREGGLVAFPTETVYGLGADALNPAAVRAVFRLKGRPSTNPLIVHVADAQAAADVCADWPRNAAVLADRFWPGPLTLVLPKGGALPDEVVAGGDTVALRCPDHPVALALLRAFGGPLVGPSANPSGRVSPTTAAHVREVFEERDVLVLDGGPCRVGIESTVLSLAGQRPRVLRAGAISAADLSDALGETIDDDAGGRERSDGGIIASPGRFASHYAPRAPAALLARDELVGRLDRSSISGEHRFVAIVLAPVDIESVDGLSEILMPAEAGAYAQRLYAALHEADERAPEAILIEEPASSGSMWDAIRDRLRRACAPGA
jgi:L-threonylcarbamoyladenylate synthase